MQTSDYWVLQDPETLGKTLSSKIADLGASEYLSATRLREQRAYLYYYGISPSGVHATSQVLRGGDVGELAVVRINHCRALVNTLVNLITSAKLVWTPKAVNEDYASDLQCELAASLLEYYWTQQGISEICNRALEEAVLFGESFVLAEWDGNSGETYAALEDAEVKTGDVKFSPVAPWDVIREPTKRSFDELDYVIVRRRLNKWTMAAKYPEQAEQVLECPSTVNPTGLSYGRDTTDNDDAEFFYFYHKKTAAVPNGLEGCFLADGTFLGAPKPAFLDYFPVIRWFAMEQNSTPFAYTPFFDILGIQELMDSLQTAIASNQTTLGNQLIAFETGSEISPDDVGGGMKALYYPAGAKPPQAIDLLRTAPEIFAHLKDLQNQQELVMGLNSVVRGEANSGEQSGSALALLSSQALQQSSVIQGHHVRAVEMLGNCLFDLLRQNLSLPRTVSLIGKNNAYLVQDSKFTGESFSSIKRIQVLTGNPMQQTTSGRMEIAKDLLQMGIIKSAEEYLDVMDTGRLEPLTKGLKRELDLIRSENEQLQRGENPPVLVLDDHLLHAREHRAVLANPQARKNPGVVNATLQHISEHEQLYYTAPASTLMLVGQTPPAAPALPPGGPPPGESSPEVTAPPGNPLAGDLPPPAEMPTNPATGEQAPTPAPPVP